MAVSNDLYTQNISTVQTVQQPLPVTIASTTTIAPTTFLTFVSGTTNVATITPPVGGAVMIALVFTNASPGSLVTTGNVSVGSTTLVQNRLNLLVYDPSSAKWYMTTP